VKANFNNLKKYNYFKRIFILKKFNENKTLNVIKKFTKNNTLNLNGISNKVIKRIVNVTSALLTKIFQTYIN
jgi:hypothetical protein